MKYSIIQQDLFKVDDDFSFVHCISFDCKMGAGIAKTFVKMYPKLKPSLMLYLSNHGFSYRQMAIGYRVNYQRAVYNLITKEHFYDKPTYRSLQCALDDLKKTIILNNTRKLAMPKIGCGLDKLNWEKVERMIKETFEDLDIEILVCEI